MKRLRWLMAPGLVFALAACCSTGAAVLASDETRPTSATRASCNAEAAQRWVGLAFEPEVLEQARLAAGAETVRLLRPDSVITKEFRVGRLNVVIDPEGRVARVHCG